jgi:hypothetical protein
MMDIPSADGGPPAKKQRQKKSTNKKLAEGIATEVGEEEADLNTVEGSGRGTSHNRNHRSHQCILSLIGCHGCQFSEMLSNVYT